MTVLLTWHVLDELAVLLCGPARCEVSKTLDVVSCRKTLMTMLLYCRNPLPDTWHDKDEDVDKAVSLVECPVPLAEPTAAIRSYSRLLLWERVVHAVLLETILLLSSPAAL